MDNKQVRLEKLREVCLQCKQCDLCQTRNKLVFGEGNPDCSLMFVAEAPGQNEDLQGRPLIGRAGTLLRQMLHAINIKDEEVYLGNILKCRPPNNRKPTGHEIESCKRFIIKQIEIIEPRYIVCLGKTAVEGLLPDRADDSVTSLRTLSKGRDGLRFQNIPVIVTYHPSALLQNPKWRPMAKEDFEFIEKVACQSSQDKKLQKIEEMSLFDGDPY